MKQYIIEHEPDSTGMLTLSGKAFVYLVKVRRMKEGDILPVRLPEQGAADMLIVSINYEKKELCLQLKQRFIDTLPSVSDDISGSVRPTAKEQQYVPKKRSCTKSTAPADTKSAELILLQWVLKGAKTDTVIRQATEAGVHTILPILGEFSIAKKRNPVQLERFRRIVKEARQQSGSPIDTAVMQPIPLVEALHILQELVPAVSTAFCMCSEEADTSVSLHRLLAVKPSHVVLAIGAEGGISPAEAEMLRKAAFKTIHFRTNVLRAETAALYAIAAAQTIISEGDVWQLLA